MNYAPYICTIKQHQKILQTEDYSRKRRKSVITYINIEDLFTNGNIDLGKFLPRLEKVAGNFNVEILQMDPSDKIIESITEFSNELKNRANKYLNKLKVCLLNKVTN